MKKFVVGEHISVKLNTSFNPALYNKVWLPCVVIGDYEKFVVVEVQPHINPNSSQGMSHPYNITVSKHDIKTGNTKIRRW